MSGRPSAATEKALRLVKGGLTPYAAAKKAGIALSTIYRAIKRCDYPKCNCPLAWGGKGKPPKTMCLK